MLRQKLSHVNLINSKTGRIFIVFDRMIQQEKDMNNRFLVFLLQVFHSFIRCIPLGFLYACFTNLIMKKEDQIWNDLW